MFTEWPQHMDGPGVSQLVDWSTTNCKISKRDQGSRSNVLVRRLRKKQYIRGYVESMLL